MYHTYPLWKCFEIQQDIIQIVFEIFPKQRFPLIAANKVHRLWNYRKGSYLALFSHPVGYVTPTEKLESFQIKVFWCQFFKTPASFHVMPIYHFRGEGALFKEIIKRWNMKTTNSCNPHVLITARRLRKTILWRFGKWFESRPKLYWSLDIYRSTAASAYFRIITPKSASEAAYG